MAKPRLCAKLTALALVLASAACSPSRPPTGVPHGPYIVGQPYKVNGRWYTPREDFAYDRVGYASWYGRDFHGRRTASGEAFDMNALTAAHATLPMPTIVRVTNLANGRSVVLRINDRGPFADDRIIDVSRAAARELRFSERGVARVRVTVMREASLRLKQSLGAAAEPPKPQRALASAANDSR
jgi:rare lipoprotein A